MDSAKHNCEYTVFIPISQSSVDKLEVFDAIFGGDKGDRAPLEVMAISEDNDTARMLNSGKAQDREIPERVNIGNTFYFIQEIGKQVYAISADGKTQIPLGKDYNELKPFIFHELESILKQLKGTL